MSSLLFLLLPSFLISNPSPPTSYFCGMTMGKKFVKSPFLKLSPNKTWEGFIGGGICTIVMGWYLSEFLAKYTWMTCPGSISPWPGSLVCDVDPVYVHGIQRIPEQVSKERRRGGEEERERQEPPPPGGRSCGITNRSFSLPAPSFPPLFPRPLLSPILLSVPHLNAHLPFPFLYFSRFFIVVAVFSVSLSLFVITSVSPLFWSLPLSLSLSLSLFLFLSLFLSFSPLSLFLSFFLSLFLPLSLSLPLSSSLFLSQSLFVLLRSSTSCPPSS